VADLHRCRWQIEVFFKQIKQSLQLGARYLTCPSFSLLGFQPHPDYKAACRVFGGIAVEACDREFAFGHKGKPFYIQGPYDSAQKCKQILTILKNRCGQGNFYYLIASNDLSDVPEEYLSGARVIEVPDQDRRR
jgi:hypothetical protein